MGRIVKRLHFFCQTIFIHFHSLSSISIHFHPFQPLSSPFNHFYPFSHTFNHSHILSSIFNNFHSLSHGRIFFHFFKCVLKELLNLSICMNFRRKKLQMSFGPPLPHLIDGMSKNKVKL